MLSRQLFTTNKKKISEQVSNDGALNNLHIDRNFIISTRDNVAASLENEWRSIPAMAGDKLHRRNPVAVRKEIQSFDDIIPETTLEDLQLNDMPGLQNTEQWKRIAARSGEGSPPLSRQYVQAASYRFQSQDGHMPDVFESYRPSGRTENEENISPVVPSLLRTPRRKILFGLSIVSILIAIITAVTVTVILVRKPHSITTDYYSGSILVQASFNPVLLTSSSTLAKNYQKEFCTLIETTLADMKTKYAIFYSACSVNNFRNGSIIGDFQLGFTRYQNVTRLNGFLTRALVNKQLFGGTILAIALNSTINIDTNITDYTETISTDLLSTEQSH